jgi:hypothetical protein
MMGYGGDFMGCLELGQGWEQLVGQQLCALKRMVTVPEKQIPRRAAETVSQPVSPLRGLFR